ncbi:26037_t:CDS:2 [Dentiscutata erythropus]|uniref:26037_t:CDS:1 n=1 Tax=Dentiscutata erythropus TaxID=1348616 RepID=A0A9N8VVA0_9GLOM|nr:26037_t:CDS:2 [Dentiscutata erythropus]
MDPLHQYKLDHNPRPSVPISKGIGKYNSSSMATAEVNATVATTIVALADILLNFHINKF